MQSERPSKCTFNPRTYSRIHTPTVVVKGGWWWNPSLEFLICCSISKRFCLQWKTFDLLNKMRYILWLVALLEACDVTNNGCHLGFYQELKIRLKPQEIFTFNVENRKAFCMCMCLQRSIFCELFMFTTSICGLFSGDESLYLLELKKVKALFLFFGVHLFCLQVSLWLCSNAYVVHNHL